MSIIPGTGQEKKHVINITVSYMIPSSTEAEAVEKALALFNQHIFQRNAEVSFIYPIYKSNQDKPKEK